ncbi:unnamed protein product [Leptosia nina]|uniref:Lipase n=1 Tax=Leptosia nina TaxID=320188 RepID=A0AAV1K090_9NEOP
MSVTKLYRVAVILMQIASVFTDQSVISAINKKGDRLTFLKLAELLGRPAEQYDVITEDGYILGIFRIPGVLQPPTLLVHGVELAADSWLLRGNKSLPIMLANLGHDVWFANVRGNIYSRRHIHLNPDVDKDFWEFSFHEHGYYDLAAIIDRILDETKASQINAIGHSQGTTMFTVLTATRPEYNDKINLSIYLAPIAYLNKVRAPLLNCIMLSPELNMIMEKMGMNEFFGYNQTFSVALRRICTLSPQVSYLACAYGYAFPIVGYDPEELEPEFYRISNYYFPVGSSRKNLIHFGQVGRTGRFGQYDHGAVKNLAIYKSLTPPLYNLTNVRIPIVLLVGRRDKLATVTDAETLRQQLPNVKIHKVLPREKANHLDFIWGRSMEEYLFPYILSAFDQQ